MLIWLVVRGCRPARLVHRRRRGSGDRLRRRSRRADHQSQPGRSHDLHDGAPRVNYAVAKGALLVAAIGNSHGGGNPVEYPAALLQPVGSRGVGGRGLSVGASTRAGTRASFSNTGTHISLAAPGEGVFGAVSRRPPRRATPRQPPGLGRRALRLCNGTSFAAPQVAGAAALVWAANPTFAPSEVAAILKHTASGGGKWSPQLGWGVLDVAAAVARAQAHPSAPLKLG
jgi:serine protease